MLTLSLDKAPLQVTEDIRRAELQQMEKLTYWSEDSPRWAIVVADLGCCYATASYLEAVAKGYELACRHNIDWKRITLRLAATRQLERAEVTIYES